jgi:hypothetical protein
MKPWDIFTWSFPDAGTHPTVIHKRGTVTPARRPQIAERVIRALAFAGL